MSAVARQATLFAVLHSLLTGPRPLSCLQSGGRRSPRRAAAARRRWRRSGTSLPLGWVARSSRRRRLWQMWVPRSSLAYHALSNSACSVEPKRRRRAACVARGGEAAPVAEAWSRAMLCGWHLAVPQQLPPFTRLPTSHARPACPAEPRGSGGQPARQRRRQRRGGGRQRGRVRSCRRPAQGQLCAAQAVPRERSPDCGAVHRWVPCTVHKCIDCTCALAGMCSARGLFCAGVPGLPLQHIRATPITPTSLLVILPPPLQRPLAAPAAPSSPSCPRSLMSTQDG